MAKYNSLILYGVSMVIIFLAGYFTHDKIHTCPVAEIDSNYISQPQDTSGYEPQIIIFEQEVDKDSIYQAMKKEWQAMVRPDTTYIRDTVYVAGIPAYGYSAVLKLNKPKVKGTISFNSRIPLDTEGYFIDSLKIIETEITKTEQVAYNPHFFVEGGIKAGDMFQCYLSAGVNLISYKHLKAPLYYEMEHAPEGGTTHSIRVGTRIEF